MYVVIIHSFTHLLAGKKSNVIQPYIMSRICSFISVNEETQTMGTVLHRRAMA